MFAVANVYTASAVCTKGNNILNTINNKLDQLLGNDGGTGVSQPPPGCKSLNFEALNNKESARLVIGGINGPFGALANGNDVYITGYYDHKVYRFNQKENPGTAAAETIASPSSYPMFFDIKDDLLYMTAYTNSVYRKPLRGGAFEKIITMTQPVGISWSPDGELLIISERSSRNVNVYDKNFQKKTSFKFCALYARDISFDSNGNIRIATYSNKLCIYESKTFHLIKIETIIDAVKTEGYMVHCDGTIILGDRGGKLLFLNKDYSKIKTVTGFSSLGDVALDEEGTLYVTDFGAKKIYLFDLF